MITETPPTKVTRVDRAMFVALTIVAMLALALAAGVVGFTIVLLPIAVLFFGFFAFVAVRPVSAAYVFLATQPFVGGIDRGSLIPLLRPSEAIQAVLVAAVLCGVVYRAVRGERLSARITKLDRAVIALCAVSSIWPLFWMLARGQIPGSTDIQDTIVLWRLAALYVLFRTVVRTPQQLRRCLWILLVSASLLAFLAILDSLGHLQAGRTVDADRGRQHQRPRERDARIVDRGRRLPLVQLRGRARVVVAPEGPSPSAPRDARASSSSEFSAPVSSRRGSACSSWCSSIAANEGQMARLAKWLGPIAAVGAVIAWPVISTRLAGFGGGGLPHSWQGRIDNLTHFYLPQLSGFHWVLGIRPNTVLAAPETWRTVIYLESGYLWLFWVGGVPLVCTFLWFLTPRVPAHQARRPRARRRRHRRRGLGDPGRALVPAHPHPHRPPPDVARRERPVLLPARPQREPERPTEGFPAR